MHPAAKVGFLTFRPAREAPGQAAWRTWLVCWLRPIARVPRRRPGAAGSNARAGNPPNSTIRWGFSSTISRCRNGRQSAISAGDGGRPPGGRHGSSGVSISSARVQTDAAEHLVQQLTLGAGERMAAAILFPARRFADDQGRAGRIALRRTPDCWRCRASAHPSKPASAARSSSSDRGLAAPARVPARPACPLARQRQRPPAGCGARRPSLDRAQPVDGVKVDRLVGAPFDLQAQQCKGVIQARRPGNDRVRCAERDSSCRHASPDLRSPAAG